MKQTIREQYFVVRVETTAGESLWLSRTVEGFFFLTPVERQAFHFAVPELAIRCAEDIAAEARQTANARGWEVLHRTVVSEVSDDIVGTSLSAVEKIAGLAEDD